MTRDGTVEGGMTGGARTTGSDRVTCAVIAMWIPDRLDTPRLGLSDGTVGVGRGAVGVSQDTVGVGGSRCTVKSGLLAWDGRGNSGTFQRASKDNMDSVRRTTRTARIPPEAQRDQSNNNNNNNIQHRESYSAIIYSTLYEES